MSHRTERLSWIFIGLVLIMATVASYWVVRLQTQPKITLRLGDGVFAMKVMDINATSSGVLDRVKKPMDPTSAVLHAYDTDARWQIDVKNRAVAYDMVWLDSNKKVVHIVKNASSESVPVTAFRSKVAARYVIELRGGTVDQKTIRIGGLAYFEDKDAQVSQL